MVTLKDLYEKVRSYERDEDDQGAFADEHLYHPFYLAWKKTHEIFSSNRIPLASGWIAKFLPANANRLRLSGYGALHAVDVVEEKIVKAWAPITAVTWTEAGTIITVDALAGLYEAGLETGKQVTLMGLPGIMSLEGEFSVVVDPNNADQSLLLPGLETRGIPAQFDAGGKVVYAEDTYASIVGGDGSTGQMRNANLRDGFRIGTNPYSWSVQSSTIQVPASSHDRVLRMRGTYGVEPPTGLDDEIPEQLVTTLIPATAGYATLGINRSRGQDMLNEAFSMDPRNPGMIVSVIDNQMKARQVADVVRRNVDNSPAPWLIV